MDKEQKAQARKAAVDDILTEMEKDGKKVDAIQMVLIMMVGHLAISNYEKEIAKLVN